MQRPIRAVKEREDLTSSRKISCIPTTRPVLASNGDFFPDSIANIHTIPRIGLALSGGAARGLAHIGVIQVLEEHGIPIAAVAGSSMGAYIGATWCSGRDGHELERLARTVRGWHGLWSLMDPAFPPRCGFIRGRKLLRRIQRTLGPITFAALKRPFHAVATNLDTLARTVFKSGPVAPAVLASCAIPGICEPVHIGGVPFADGAVVEPVPVRTAWEMGMDLVIAVCVLPTADFQKLISEREIEATRGKTSHWGWLNDRLNYFARSNVLDTVNRSLGAAQMGLAERACAQASLVIRPLSLDGCWYEFHHPEKYIALGRRAALAEMGNLKKLLGLRSPAFATHHNSQPAHEPTVAPFASRSTLQPNDTNGKEAPHEPLIQHAA